nr:AMP-binding protein [Sphingomonas sp. HDW15A]
MPWQEWTLPLALRDRAIAAADQTFVSIIEGRSITYGELHADAERVASHLASLGVAAGDRVAVILPTGLDFLRAWAGIGRLGAVLVALNTELSGTFLAHQLRDADARLIIAHENYMAGIAEVLPSGTIPILLSGGSFDAWKECPPYDGEWPVPSDIACIMYTSGTTGPAKGVLMPHAHCYLFGVGTIDNLGLASDDHYYVTLPLFHANGLFMQIGAVLIAGARASVRTRFSASNWVSDIRDCGATITNMLGATTAFVAAQPSRPNDCEHKLRLVAAAPNHPDHEQMWRDRFGVKDVVGLYGMTEVNIPLYGERGRAKPGTCGRVYDRYFEVAIRDPQTDEVRVPGEVGEITVRPRVPFGFMAGYHGQPDKTVEAWRNLWFHTGDAGFLDADGYVIFLDRIKDCIRRRGENISSFELEEAIRSIAGIEEVAAFAVPSDFEGAEDEVMIAVTGEAVPTAQFISEQAQQLLPRYAWPRFIERLDELPKTSTGKVRKEELRRRGVSANTFDSLRAASGEC